MHRLKLSLDGIVISFPRCRLDGTVATALRLHSCSEYLQPDCAVKQIKVEMPIRQRRP